MREEGKEMHNIRKGEKSDVRIRQEAAVSGATNGEIISQKEKDYKRR